jgi:hypothetical protein
MIHKNLHGKESVLYLHSQIGSNIGLNKSREKAKTGAQRKG